MQTARLSLLFELVQSVSSENVAGPVRHVFDAFKHLSFADGIGAGQADKGFSDRRTLAASANEDLDLSGVFTNAFAVAQVIAKIKLLIIYNRSTTQTLVWKQAAASGVTTLFGAAAHAQNIGPGGFVVLYNPNGYAITAGSADLINVANPSGASADYDIYGIGTGA